MTILKSSDVILFNSDSPQNSGKTGVVNSQRKLLHAVVVGVTRNKTLILLLAFISEKIGPGQFFIHSNFEIYLFSFYSLAEDT